jgi:hypothetical protein
VVPGAPALGGPLEDLLEGAAVELALGQVGVGADHGEVVELVPALVLLVGRARLPPGALGERLEGLAVPAHRAVHDAGGGHAALGEPAPERAGLLPTGR